MTARTFRGPQEYAFPHQQALEGATGTLVLTPGQSYDFGTDETGQERRPIGPAWWWDPEPAPEPVTEAATTPGAPAAEIVPLADVFSDSYGDSPALAGAEG